MPTHSINRQAWWLLVLLLAFIVASSAAWLAGATFPDVQRTTLLFATLAVCGTTLANLTLRWLRWHFLLRTLRIRLRARESLLVFSSLLPMILTPWATGELLLTLPLQRRAAHPFRSAALVWIASRGADAFSLVLILFFTKHGLLPAALAFILVSTLALAFIERRGPLAAQLFRLYLFFGISLMAWSCAASGLHLALSILGGQAPYAESLSAFSLGTVLGSFTGIPSGIAVTGSAVIRELARFGIQEPLAIWSVAALRWGTVGFAVLLGLLVALFHHRSLAALIRGNGSASQGHFDGIASTYAEELPAHIRERLIDTKTAVLRRSMERHSVPADGRGLDIGCGQGWYLARLAQHGYTMDGCDLTAAQIEEARRYCDAANANARLIVASADAMPFADNTFDFAYTINVLHHITDPTVFANALRETVRVLKPGAPLIVFEMNTLNPLFRLYLSYIFPFIRSFDDGTEVWLRPGNWPEVDGASWSEHIDYITFIPDFLPKAWMARLADIERWLERSAFKSFSAHFAVALVKQPDR